MAGSLNVVMLIGHLGRDAELRYTPAGAAVTTFSLATTETWTDKDNRRQEKTEWHRVVLWGKVASALAEYLTKGKQVYVSGRLQTREWKDKDGLRRFATEVRADKVILLGGGQRRDNGPEHVRDVEVGSAADPGFGTDPDIPFAWLLPFILPAILAVGTVLA